MMNIHFKEPTMADGIRQAITDNPNLSSVKIAEMTGARPEYVRVVKQRLYPKTLTPAVRNALQVTCDAYRASVELRRECEANSQDRELYARYCEAWETHKAAEKVFLSIEKVRHVSTPRQPIKGVPVREIMERSRQFGRAAGKAR